MRISEKDIVHLTYCLNIHPGETWAENYKTIQTVVRKIRNRVAPQHAFGLSLRMGHLAAQKLKDNKVLEKFKAYLESQNMYVFTVNGFPYGNFHHPPVKENVYSPDWRTERRLDYTNLIADILAKIMPQGFSGSISTVPGSYKAWINSTEDRNVIVKNLMRCVVHLAELRERTGREIHIGLEPEPDCLFETTPETISYFQEDLWGKGRRYLSTFLNCTDSEAERIIRHHIGICFDTCHMSLQFENLTESLAAFRKEKIRISKIQLSAALATVCSENSIKQLTAFQDPVYLHQVKVYDGQGRIRSYRDLPDALADRIKAIREAEAWRVHFHVPLYFEGDKDLRSTATDLTPGFFKKARASGCEHLEIETYTFNVLPEPMRKKGVIQSVSDEYAWVLARV